jgi:hypothetical protein
MSEDKPYEALSGKETAPQVPIEDKRDAQSARRKHLQLMWAGKIPPGDDVRFFSRIVISHF